MFCEVFFGFFLFAENGGIKNPLKRWWWWWGGGSYSCLLPPTCTISDVCVWRDTTFALGDSAYEIKELVEHIKLVSINTRPRVFINLYCFAFVVRFEKFSMK